MLARRTWLTIALLLLPVALLVLAAEGLGVRLLERIAINLCISLILVVGLQVFMGNSGILSFAHIGFMGVGAYASAVFSIPARMKGMALPDLYPAVAGLELSPYLAIAIGALVAAAVAALVSYPLMRLSDAAAVITSFALLVVLHTIMLHWSEVTNGPRTLFGLPKATDLHLAAGLEPRIRVHGGLDAVPGWSALVGSASLLFAALERGGDGSICAAACFAARRCADLFAAFRAGDRGRARALQDEITPLDRRIVGGLGAAGVKAAMHAAGLYGGPVRAPLADLSDAETSEVAALVRG